MHVQNVASVFKLGFQKGGDLQPMDSLTSILELGKAIDEMPKEKCGNVIAQWKAQKITIGTGCKNLTLFYLNFLSNSCFTEMC